jgi:hypothetical protein
MQNARLFNEAGLVRYIPQLRRLKTVAIVGNGPIDSFQSYEIDAHDVVVRFNGCRNYGVSGQRTDYLVLTNTGEPARQFAFDPLALNAQAVESAGRILLARPPDLVASELRRFPNDREYWETFDQDLIGRIRHKRWTYMRAHIYRKARSVLRLYGARKTDQPSTGILAIFHIAQQLRRRMQPSAITLYGFTHQGWDRHPWNAERQLIDDRWRGWVRRAQPVPDGLANADRSVA